MDIYDADSEFRPVPKKSVLPPTPRYLGERERHESEVQDKNDYAKFDFDVWRATSARNFEINVDGPRPIGQRGIATVYGPPVRRRYVLKAGDEVAIPMIYRNAIRRVIGNEVVGGLCPSGLDLLTPSGGVVALKIAPAIDPSRPPPSTGGMPEAGAEGRLKARLKGSKS